MAFTPEEIVAQSSCFQCKIPDGFETSALIYVLNQVAGNLSVEAIIEGAKCYQCKIPDGLQWSALLFLFNQINSGSTPSVSPVLTLAGDGFLTWTYSGSGPVYWVIQQSPIGFGSWTNYSTVSGSHFVSDSFVAFGKDYRIFGSVDGTTVSTGYSNTVTS